MSLIESILNRLLKKKVIVNCEREEYLHRWYLLRTDRVAIFIHKFVRSDEDRALHDHPWNFIVIPIWRGYIEHRPAPCPSCGKRIGCTKEQEARRVLPIIGTRFRRAEYRHRVELLNGPGEFRRWSGGKYSMKVVPLPAWSIFIRFRERRTWGFWDKITGFIAWNKWWQEKCE